MGSFQSGELAISMFLTKREHKSLRISTGVSRQDLAFTPQPMMGVGEREEELADHVYSYPAPPSQPLPAIPLPLTSGTEEDTG